MPTDALICPACSSHLKRPTSLRNGDVFECPMCATEFNASSGGRSSASRQSRRDEAEEEVLDELDAIDDEARPGKRRRRKKRSQSGAVELGRWIQLGFAHWFPMLPPSIGFCILYVLGIILISLPLSLISLIPVLGPILSTITIVSLAVSWSAGMTLVSLQQLQGKRWSFGDFFSGSQWWMALLLNWLLLEIIYGFLLFAPAIILGMALRALAVPPFIIPLATSTYMLVAFVCLYPLTWMFSWQLIVDGNYGPMEAIMEGMRMALPNYWRLLLVAVVTLLLRVIGYLLFFIGFAGTWPLAVLIETTAYLRLTGRRVVESSSEVN